MLLQSGPEKKFLIISEIDSWIGVEGVSREGVLGYVPFILLAKQF
jgi:hypothetical protein